MERKSVPGFKVRIEARMNDVARSSARGVCMRKPLTFETPHPGRLRRTPAPFPHKILIYDKFKRSYSFEMFY